MGPGGSVANDGARFLLSTLSHSKVPSERWVKDQLIQPRFWTWQQIATDESLQMCEAIKSVDMLSQAIACKQIRFLGLYLILTLKGPKGRDQQGPQTP